MRAVKGDVGGEWSVAVAQDCDNMGAAGVASRNLSTKEPMCFAMQCLAATAITTGSRVHVSHRAGERNEWADSLSRMMMDSHAKFRGQLDASAEFRFDL